jgi:parallel beta-helix repeat protein
MSGKLDIFLCLFVLSSSLVYVRFKPVEVKAPNGYPLHNLDSGLNYTTIQEAIDAAETLDGHTILVDEGTYYEHLVVNKSLSLIGEDRFSTIIDGNCTGNVIIITANNVKITGFTVQRSGKVWTIDNRSYGICFQWGISGSNVSYNVITDNLKGIWLYNSNANTISGNNITNNVNEGIVLDFSSNDNNVYGNTITNNRVGIGGWNSSTNSIYGNDITNNEGGVGLIYFSNNNSVYGNNITNNENGIVFEQCLDNSIYENNIRANDYDSIGLYESSLNNTIYENNIRDSNDSGITLVNSNTNNVYENNITNNHKGVKIWFSSNNNVYGNNITNNEMGLDVEFSSNNNMHHNNFVDNTHQVSIIGPGYANFWDNGLEGNYWSDYNRTDANHDGIGDTPRIIDANNTDNHPLMGEFHNYHITHIEPDFALTLISNSTIPYFDVVVLIEHPATRIILFNVTGETGYGFCRLCIPKTLMTPPYTVTIDNGQTAILHYNETLVDNSTHRWIYFAYLHSEHQVEIIPEFPSFLMLPIFMIATLLTVIVYRRKHLKIVWFNFCFVNDIVIQM